MAKAKTQFVCQSCGYQAPKWLGRCPGCQNWNTFVEERIVDEKVSERDLLGFEAVTVPTAITEIVGEEKGRFQTGIGEFDRVLGGGIVFGSVILVGGDPGIGKSTLLLQMMCCLASTRKKVLYVSGEESLQQTKMRADRLGVSSDHLFVVSETSLEKILQDIQTLRPSTVVIDSIQTIYSSDLPSTPGSISQVREAASKLLYLAKHLSIPIFLVGHVTKEGFIAGPKVLEHMVDTVLYIEGEANHAFRILRAVKNRFGSTNEIGVFEMKDSGLVEVLSPSEFFLSERTQTASGSAVMPSIEGSRPILIELQALVVPTNLGVPRRMAQGVDGQRVSLLVAVMEKRLGVHLFNHDIFLNIAGGIKVEEPGADLGMIAAISSSFRDKVIDPEMVVFGEVGLGGEVRGVSQPEVRVKEAARLGFKRVLLPKPNQEKIKGVKGIELIGVRTVGEAIEKLF
ncbi:MAG: DNA repair protein RadA [Deltaproteobacteria bacterium RBG_16_49_23]|nr:MAG: DNA repair protein RadA [Deltaproteobacteria bacterium RBG_16_49_23]